MNLFHVLNKDISGNMEKLILSIDKVFPLPRRFANNLKHDVKELSALFTSRRSELLLSYLNKPNLFSAYLRFFLPWNVFRLCKFLPKLDINLKDGDTVLDIGSGPLTFVLALWISRPDLRNTSLEFFVLDKTPKTLDAGEKIFTALRSDNGIIAGKWKIKKVRGEFSGKGLSPEKINNNNFAFISAINVFNEIYYKLSPRDKSGLEKITSKSAAVLAQLSKNGSLLVIEPGIPRGGEFISSLRSAFLDLGFDIVSPCLHKQACPYPGGLVPGKGKAKWCHFSFNTDEAPKSLKKLSMSAGIPKERAVLSFIYVRENSKKADSKKYESADSKKICRIISDVFPVERDFGSYVCSADGPLLIKCSKAKAHILVPGNIVNFILDGNRDKKIGALTGLI